MQVQAEERIVETEGLGDDIRTFKISQSKKMFTILSSTLYSDKTAAVIREYGCNAYDAHIAAGKRDVPFTVHLPNDFEPWFAVKDYGTGLDHEDVLGLYSMYGWSSKSEENNSVGMLGLGSKSAFAYADQFSVISRFEGKVRTYGAFVDEAGTPTITLLDEEETDEVNGLEVRIPVKSADFDTFAEKAKQIFFRFPVHPEIVGRYCELDKCEYAMEGPGYKVRTNDPTYHGYGRSQVYAIQGVVAYPIDASKFSIPLEEDMKDFMQNVPVDLFFEIGQLDVAPSREALSYDKNTQANIIAAMKAMMEHIPGQFDTVMDHCQSLWEAKKFYHQWFQEQGELAKRVLRWTGKKIKWRDHIIEDSRIYIRLIDEILVEDHVSEDNPLLPLRDSVGEYTPVLKSMREWGEIYYFDGRRYGIFGTNDDRKFKAATTTTTQLDVRKSIIVIDDVNLKFPHTSPRMMFQDFGVNHDVYMFRNVTDLPRLMNELGNPPHVLYTSTMGEEPPLPPSEYAKRKKTNIKSCYEVCSFSSRGLELRDVSIDVGLGGLYLLMYQKDTVAPHPNGLDDYTYTNNNINEVFRLFEAIGQLKDQPVYGFNSSFRSLPQKADNWINLFDYVRPKLEELFSPKRKKLHQAMSTLYWFAKDSHDKYSDDYYQSRKFEKISDFVREANPSAKMAKLLSFVDKQADVVNKELKTVFTTSEATAVAHRFYELSELADKYFKIKKIEPLEQYKNVTAETMDKIAEAYPMIHQLLAALSDYSYQKTAIKTHHIVHYIKLCEASSKTVKLFKENDNEDSN